MRLKDIADTHHGRLETQDESIEELLAMSESSGDVVKSVVIGKSVEERSIYAFEFGSGPVSVSIVAGSHADEPVGSETIRHLIRSASEQSGVSKDISERCTFYLIPQVNPDGEHRNRLWMREWPKLDSYITNTVRELPGRDIEFGYPAMRPENKSASEYWADRAPIDLHVSLHGMGYAEGVMLLIERHWTSRTQDVRDSYTRLAATHGLGLHTHNRKGEKGFFYIENGYTTTPEGEAMKDHFRSLGDEDTASLFHSSSMEYMRSISPDPLSLVTEIPLFSLNPSSDRTLIPENYVAFKALLPQLQQDIAAGRSIQAVVDKFGVSPVQLHDAMQLQLEAIELGIETVEAHKKLLG